MIRSKQKLMTDSVLDILHDRKRFKLPGRNEKYIDIRWQQLTAARQEQMIASR
jgi:hypothetical protein